MHQWALALPRARLRRRRQPLCRSSMTSIDERRPGRDRRDLPPPAPSRRHRACSGRSRSALALLSALATFLVLADLTPIAPTHDVVVTLLLVNALTGAAAARHHRPRGLADRAGAPARPGRPRGCMCASSACSRSIAAVPAILVAVVASVTLDRGLDRLFSTRTRADDREFADRRRRLSARARADRCAATSWRWRSTWRAPSRCSITTASASSNSSPRRRRCAACRPP